MIAANFLTKIASLLGLLLGFFFLSRQVAKGSKDICHHACRHLGFVLQIPPGCHYGARTGFLPEKKLTQEKGSQAQMCL